VCTHTILIRIGTRETKRKKKQLALQRLVDGDFIIRQGAGTLGDPHRYFVPDDMCELLESASWRQREGEGEREKGGKRGGRGGRGGEGGSQGMREEGCTNACKRMRMHMTTQVRGGQHHRVGESQCPTRSPVAPTGVCVCV